MCIRLEYNRPANIHCVEWQSRQVAVSVCATQLIVVDVSFLHWLFLSVYFSDPLLCFHLLIHRTTYYIITEKVPEMCIFRYYIVRTSVSVPVESFVVVSKNHVQHFICKYNLNSRIIFRSFSAFLRLHVLFFLKLKAYVIRNNLQFKAISIWFVELKVQTLSSSYNNIKNWGFLVFYPDSDCDLNKCMFTFGGNVVDLNNSP